MRKNREATLSFIVPSNHEKADTRALLHAKDASESGIGKVQTSRVDLIQNLLQYLLTCLNNWICWSFGLLLVIYLEMHMIRTALGPA